MNRNQEAYVIQTSTPSRPACLTVNAHSRLLVLALSAIAGCDFWICGVGRALVIDEEGDGICSLRALRRCEEEEEGEEGEKADGWWAILGIELARLLFLSAASGGLNSLIRGTDDEQRYR